MKYIIKLVLLIAIILPNVIFGQTLVKNMSSTDGDVYSVYKSGGAYYLGGNFHYVGLKTGYDAFVTASNDYPDMNFPAVTNGQVYAILPDGSGGWYVGGYFTQIAGVNKNYIAHILSNKTVDANFTASCNYAVLAIAKVGTTLYIGGGFTTVNGTTRNYAAAVKSNTGALINGWNPSPNYQVRTICPILGTDTTIWLGGDFSTINNGISRPYLVKVNNSNGNIVGGTLSADQPVFKMVARGDSVIAGGAFTRLGLKTDRLASITEGSGQSDQSMPEANGRVSCIISDGSGGWYVGGYFTVIGGVSKNYIAHVLSNKTVDPNFTASCNNVVLAIVKDGSRLYIGGWFSTVNSTARNYLAAVNATNGSLISNWDANANYVVKTLALKDTVVLAGGDFTLVKGKNGSRFAALNKTNGAPVGGFPGYNSSVNKIAVKNDSILVGGAYYNSANYSPYSAKMTTASVTLDPKFPATNGKIWSVVPDGSGNYYVGGEFSVIGGVNQPYIAKLNSNFDVITGWAPPVNYVVRSILVVGTTVYIGGLFSQTNGVARTSVSALNTANPGSNKTWNSSMNSGGYVYTLVTDGTSIYAGGTFTQVNGSTRNLLAKFDLNGNLDASWNPNASGGGGSVEQLAISGTNVLAAGSFTTVGGNSRNYLAKLNNTNGAASNWATANSYVFALVVDGTTCYAGGYFTQLTSAGGVNSLRNYIGAITISNGNINTFNPNPDSYVFAIRKSGSIVYFGGQFTHVNGTERKYLAGSNTSNALQSWDPSANYVVRAIIIDASNNVFVGGDFSGFKERAQQRASVIKYSNRALAAWQPTIDYDVYDISYTSDKIIIGGAFDNVNGSSRNGFAAFSLNGTLKTTTLTLLKGGVGTNASVWSLFVSGNKVYVGGDFDNAKGLARNDFVETDVSSGSGTVLTTNPSPDNIVFAINVTGTTIVFGGDFGFSNFSFRNHIAIIKSASKAVAPWNHSIDYRVFDIAYNYNKIFVVGEFDNVDGIAHRGAAAFNLSTGALLTWNPQLANNGVDYYADLNAVAADSNTVYLGGNFTTAAGQPRTYAAAVASGNAALQTWNPSPSYIVRSIGFAAPNLLLGGDFQHCKGATRNYVAKIDSATGLVNSTWNPGTSYVVNVITGNGNTIYIGGSFNTLAGVTRNNLGSVNASTGVATSFDPNIGGTVTSLAFDGAGILYVGGAFNTAKAVTRNNAASFSTGGSGTLQSWNPNTNGQVNALAVNGSTVYIGGQFTTLNGGTSRNYLGAVNNTNGNVTTFNPNMNSYVYSLWRSGNTLYAGGLFYFVNGGTTSRNRLAAYDATTGSLKTWNASADNAVFAIAASSDSIYIGGDFSNLNGTSRIRLGAVRGSAGTALLAFNPAADNRVQSHYVADYVLLTGGYFDNISGTTRGGFAVYKLPGATVPQSISKATGIQASVMSAHQFLIYPNPLKNGSLTIMLDNSITGKFDVVITTLNGTRLLAKTFDTPAKSIVLDVGGLQNGLYNVSIVNEKINWTTKLLIQR